MKRLLKQLMALQLAAALLLPLAACGNKAKATTIHLKRTEGRVAVSDDAGEDVPLLEDLGLYSGYEVSTRSKSFAWINLDDVKLTKMDEKSEIAIEKEDKLLEIEVKSGALFFNVTQPLEEDETMNIRTSTMIVGIRGTCGWVVDNGEKGAQVYILEGRVEAEAVETEETVTVSAGEMAQVAVTEDGEIQIEVQPFAEEYVPEFVQIELEEDEDLSAAVLAASGLDVLDPPDPAERLRAEYEEIIAGQTILDQSAGGSYTEDGITYSNEGLSYAITLDMNGDGTEELVLVTQKGDFSYPGTITKLEVYGVSMGHAVLYDKLNVAEGEYVNGDIPTTFYLRSDGIRPCLWLEHAAQYLGSIRVYALEDRSLTLVDGSDDEGRGMNAGYDDIPETQFTVCPLPKIPSNIQGKAELLEELNSHEYDEYPKYARLADTDQDGEDEMYLLSTDFCVYDWDGTQMQSTVLENNVTYAKLIDMDQDGKEDLLLVLNPAEWSYSAVVYSWSDAGKLDKKAMDIGEYPYGLKIFREKSTGEIYLGGMTNQGTGGEDSIFISLTDSVYAGFENYNPYWDYGDLDELTPAERAEVDARLAESSRSWEKYEAQVNRFELIESIDPDSYEWQEVLAHTVDEVRQQLMAR